MPATTRRLTSTPSNLVSKLRQIRHNKCRSSFSSHQDPTDGNGFHNHGISSFERPISRHMSTTKTNTHTRRMTTLTQSTRIPCTNIRRFSLQVSIDNILINSSPRRQSNSQLQSRHTSVNEDVSTSLLPSHHEPRSHSYPEEQDEEEDEDQFFFSPTSPVRSLQGQLHDLELEYMNLREEQEKIYSNLSSPVFSEDALISPFTVGWNWGR